MKVPWRTGGVQTGDPQASRTLSHQSPIPTSEISGFCTSTSSEAPEYKAQAPSLLEKRAHAGAGVVLGPRHPPCLSH